MTTIGFNMYKYASNSAFVRYFRLFFSFYFKIAVLNDIEIVAEREFAHYTL